MQSQHRLSFRYLIATNDSLCHKVCFFSIPYILYFNFRLYSRAHFQPLQLFRSVHAVHLQNTVYRLYSVYSVI